MFVQNLNRIVRKPNVTPRFPYWTVDSIKIDLMFQENFSTHTQVWNCLSHHPKWPTSKWLWTKWNDLSYLSVLQQQPVLNEKYQSSGGQVFQHVHGFGPTTNWSQPETVAKIKAASLWRFVVVEPNHSWWWPFKSHTNTKETRTSSAFTAAIDKNNNIPWLSPYTKEG